MRVGARARDIVPSQIRRITDRARPTSLHLGLGQPDLPVHPDVTAALAEYVGRHTAPYTPNLGTMASREAVATHLGVEPDEVMVVAGVQQGLAVAFLGLIEPGDEVLVPDPGFPAYANLVRIAGGIPVPYRLDAQMGWRLDPARVEAAMTPRTRAVLLNSPSNPTGGVAAPHDVEAVTNLCAARGIAWISDEIYEDFVYVGEHVSPARFAPAAGLRIGGLSKSHAMMGWRLGWVTGDAAVVDGLKGLHQHLVTSANGAAQWATSAALRVHPLHVAAVRETFARRAVVLQQALADNGVACPAAAGAFYHFVDVREASQRYGGSVALAEAILEDCDVVTIPGSGFGETGESFLRLAFTVDESKLREAGHRVAGFLVHASRG